MGSRSVVFWKILHEIERTQLGRSKTQARVRSRRSIARRSFQDKKSTGNRYHRRSNFAHSTNFIGWYVDKSNKLLGISRNNAYLQYLAYHQGQAGFKTGAYKTKYGLLKVAKKTANTKNIFDHQLKKCL